MEYSITTTGQHERIAPITNENPNIRRISKTQYVDLLTGQVFNYTIQNGRSYTSLCRARNRLLDLIYTNVTPTSIFLTLTIQANMQDNAQNRDIYYKYMKLFCKSDVFRECFGTSYLYTVERQKRGALHSHLICIELLKEKLPYTKLIATWRKIIGGIGSVKIIKIDDPDHIGLYLAKYIRKEFANVPKDRRLFVPSKKLKKPIKKKITEAEFKQLSKEFRQEKFVVKNGAVVTVYKR